MNWLLPLLIGVLIGWLVEWLIDVYYWRRRSAGNTAADSPERAASFTRVGSTNAGATAASAAEREHLWREDLATIQAQAAEIAGLRARVAELSEVERRLQDYEGRGRVVSKAIEIPATDLPAAFTAADTPSSSAAATPLAAADREDDLEIIEGIGPKIALLLKEAGIGTFAGLAAVDLDRLLALLEAAGPRFQLADPSTWPQQAALAAFGRWDDLKSLQASLTAGAQRRP